MTQQKWISNIGYDAWNPPENLDTFSLIEVRFRNGETEIGCAGGWDGTLQWRELDGFDTDIVAYRILRK